MLGIIYAMARLSLKNLVILVQTKKPPKFYITYTPIEKSFSSMLMVSQLVVERFTAQPNKSLKAKSDTKLTHFSEEENSIQLFELSIC